MEYKTTFGKATGNSIDAQKLEAYARYWYAQSERSEFTTIEEAIAKFESSDDTAVNLLLLLLKCAGDELGYGGQSLTDCCRELASYGLGHEQEFGCRIIESLDGNRHVVWTSSDDAVWVQLRHVLEAMQSEGEVPDWWTDDFTDYEVLTDSGIAHVSLEDLATDDPRHPDYHDEHIA